MTQLGNGLLSARHDEDALSVMKAELSMSRRLGVAESHMLIVQSNLAITYRALGLDEQSLSMRQEVYSGFLKLKGLESLATLGAANNYAISLLQLNRFEEPKSLMRKMIPVAQRVLGEGDRITLIMRRTYGESLYNDPTATLDDLREAVTTLEDVAPTARRVLGCAHPIAEVIEGTLRNARAGLRARETPSSR